MTERSQGHQAGYNSMKKSHITKGGLNMSRGQIDGTNRPWKYERLEDQTWLKYEAGKP